ncbi:MAG: sigma-70 family RNA polymerase sigma factor [Planctomycetota bacterium JB042]
MPLMVDEPSLVSRASRGDPVAVDALLENHLPGLRAFIRLRMGRDLRARESCSDLAQSVCREVLEHIGRFRYRGEAEFRRWLYVEAQRKIANRVQFHRAERRDVQREVRAPTEADDRRLGALYRGTLTPSRRLLAKEQVERLEEAFDRLTDDHREVVVLSRIVGLSRAEVAERMGRTEDSVRNLLHRALSKLAGDLADRSDG